MRFCRECGKQISDDITDGICYECKNQKNTQKKSYPKWYNLSRGLKYPLSISFLIISILSYNLNLIGLGFLAELISQKWYYELIFRIVLLFIGIYIKEKEQANLFATIGILIILLPTILGILSVLWFAFEIFKAFN